MVGVIAPLLHLIAINLTEIERGFSIISQAERSFLKMNTTKTSKRNSLAIDNVAYRSINIRPIVHFSERTTNPLVVISALAKFSDAIDWLHTILFVSQG